MAPAYFLAPSLDYDFNRPIPEVIKRRDELCDKYSEKIKAGDPATITMIEDELIKMASEKIKASGNESYDYFDCGVGKFGNHYKKSSITNGAILNPFTKKIEFIKSNLMDGLEKDEISKFGNLIVQGGTARGVDTQQSGYMRKRFDNAFQVVSLDEPGSDCGTKITVKVRIEKNIKDLFIHRYIVENGGLKLLTPENIGSYVGKEVQLRSPLCCKGDKICNKCAGEMFYKIGIKYAGLVSDQMAGQFLNTSMAKFHDATVSGKELNIEKFIKEE